MRLITVKAPEGAGKMVAEIAFQTGIDKVSLITATQLYPDKKVVKDVIDIETATPLAKKFIETLTSAPFYDPETYSFNLREPQSIFGSLPVAKLVHPIFRPTLDVFQELYQYTKITISLVVRVFISALILSYGLIENSLPFIVAGLLFLPFHHHLMGIAMGILIREWRYVLQTVLALSINSVLIFIAGILVALIIPPPLKFQTGGSILSGAIISVIIGIAAALSTADDAGRKELIGLAAATNISIYPAMTGIQLVFGEINSRTGEHLISFALNILLVIAAAYLTYLASGMKGSNK